MKRRQRGMILLSAIVLVSLAAVVTTALFFDTGMSQRRSAANFSMEQALQFGRGTEAVAAWALTEDRDQLDTPNDSWATPLPPQEVMPGQSIEAQLVDLQGRFNLNTLVNSNEERDENAHKVFVRLLELLELEPRWADMIGDWIDPDVQPSPEGGEDSLYTSQQPPYRTANMAISSTTELLQLPGFTREMYAALAPHVTALPPTVRAINVCTADGFVLDALYALSASSPGHTEFSLLTVEELAERRKAGCFPRRSVITSNEQAMQAIAIERSHWFRLHTWVRIGTAQFALYSLLNRDNGNQVRPYARSFGTE